jgi:hypothetical protein
MFRMKGRFLTNEKGKVMDVSGNKDKENQNIIVWKKHGGLNQQWDVIYADKWKRDPIKGELNSEFGMVVERDFYVVSQMSSKRYLDILGRNIVIKIKWKKNSKMVVRPKDIDHQVQKQQPIMGYPKLRKSR